MVRAFKEFYSFATHTHAFTHKLMDHAFTFLVEAGPHFTNPGRMEGWVDLDGLRACIRSLIQVQTGSDITDFVESTNYVTLPTQKCSVELETSFLDVLCCCLRCHYDCGHHSADTWHRTETGPTRRRVAWLNLQATLQASRSRFVTVASASEPDRNLSPASEQSSASEMCFRLTEWQTPNRDEHIGVKQDV